MKVPYDEGGALMSYAGGYRPTQWLENTPFVATMRLTGYSRGRSAVTFTWEDEGGRCWPMFASEFTRVCMEVGVSKGVCFATWHVVKRGANYSLALLGEATDEP